MVEQTTSRRIEHPKREFYACAIGFASYVGTTYGLIGLQTSINVRSSLGAYSVFIYYVSLFFGIFLTPHVLKKFGTKYALIYGELFIMFYTLANFYPRWYSMYPAAILAGLFSTSWSWSAAPALGHSLVLSFTGKKHNPDVDNEIQRYFGMFFGIVALGQIISNTCTNLILSYVGANASNPVLKPNITTSSNTTFFNVSEEILSCGSKDCPASYAYGNSTKLLMFTPKHTALFALLGFYLFLQVMALIIHSSMLTNNVRENSESSRETEVLLDESQTNLLEGNELNVFSDYLKTLKTAFKFIFSLQGLLTMPINLLYGIAISFAWSDLNRAYVSCVSGVDQIGLCTAMVDFLSFVTSLVISKCTCFGLPFIMMFGLIYDLTNFTSLLLWIPTPTTKYMSYVFSLMYGVTHGTRRNSTFLVSVKHCPDQYIRFPVQLMSVSVGGMVTYLSATAICVYIKIYFMMGTIVLSTILWMTAYYILRKQKPVGTM